MNADNRTSYPGITPLYWRADRSDWGPPVRIKDDLGSEVCRRCHCLDTGLRPRRLETVPCPLRRTTRSECIKNTLIGKETEHRQSRWIKSCCFNSICPQATRKMWKLRWFVVPGDTRSPDTFDFCCRHLSNSYLIALKIHPFEHNEQRNLLILVITF